jgi:hypothetical protein
MTMSARSSSLRLQRFSFRFAEQVLNSKLSLKEEIDTILLDTIPDITKMSRPVFNRLLLDRFVAQGWESQPAVFDDPNDPGAKMDFLKERIGVEVGFGHASFIGIDLLKFQVASYSALDKIDVGIYVVTTSRFQRFMKAECSQTWEGSLTLRRSNGICRISRARSRFRSASWD